MLLLYSYNPLVYSFDSDMIVESHLRYLWSDSENNFVNLPNTNLIPNWYVLLLEIKSRAVSVRQF